VARVAVQGLVARVAVQGLAVKVAVQGPLAQELALVQKCQSNLCAKSNHRTYQCRSSLRRHLSLKTSWFLSRQTEETTNKQSHQSCSNLQHVLLSTFSSKPLAMPWQGLAVLSPCNPCPKSNHHICCHGNLRLRHSLRCWLNHQSEFCTTNSIQYFQYIYNNHQLRVLDSDHGKRLVTHAHL